MYIKILSKYKTHRILKSSHIHKITTQILNNFKKMKFNLMKYKFKIKIKT